MNSGHQSLTCRHHQKINDERSISMRSHICIFTKELFLSILLLTVSPATLYAQCNEAGLYTNISCSYTAYTLPGTASYGLQIRDCIASQDIPFDDVWNIHLTITPAIYGEPYTESLTRPTACGEGSWQDVADDWYTTNAAVLGWPSLDQLDSGDSGGFTAFSNYAASCGLEPTLSVESVTMQGTGCAAGTQVCTTVTYITYKFKQEYTTICY